MILSTLSSRIRSRRGVVAIMVAALLTVLVGVAAIALDGGLLQDNRRRVQAATDAAAMAAATALYQHFSSITTTTPDPGGNGLAAARDVASRNGYPNDDIKSTVTVNIPPKTGPFTGQVDYAEVIITYYQKRYFSSIWGSANVPVQARAVAIGFWGGTGDGVILLDPTASGSLNTTGTAGLSVTGGATVVVDSNNAQAALATGGGGATADNFHVTGNYSGTLTGTVTTGTQPIPDPLAYLPVPAVPPDGVMTTVHLTMGNKQYTLTPGRYTSLPNLNQGDILILEQASYDNNGIYYLDGSGFKSSGANILMDPATSGGVMIYYKPNGVSQGFQISGNPLGVVNLSALTSGPYAGILFWQDRTSTVDLSLSGNGSFSLIGPFYAANANVSASGNGVAVVGSQYISRTLTLSGNGNVIINYTDAGTARKRDIRLVE